MAILDPTINGIPAEEMLRRSLVVLETHYADLRQRYGDRFHEIQNPDGSYIATQILTARVTGYAALLNKL